MNAQAVNMEFLPHLRNQSMLFHGQYCIQYVLGYGLSSWSYLALDNNLDTLVVIKEYFPHGHCQRVAANGKVALYDPNKREIFNQGSERFASDARRLAMFNHFPGAVSVYNMFRENGTVYLAMEYQPGHKLNAWLQSQSHRPDWPEAIQEITPVLEVLQAMHSKGEIRGDLNPEVFYRCEGGRLMLLDISSPQLEGHQNRPALSPIIVPGYAAFEQHTSPSAVGPLADIHAAAAVLFWMLTGQSLPSALERAVYDRVPDLVVSSEAIPVRAKATMIRGLAFKMRERFSSCQEFLEVLQQTLHNPALPLDLYEEEASGEVDAELPSGAETAGEKSGEMTSENTGETTDYETLDEGGSEAYTGKTAFGLKHGQGNQVYKNGDRYAGEWLLGRRHGQGTYYYANGSQYQGQWKWDRKNGQGKLIYANGDKYIGEWKDDERNGQGKEMLANGERYNGQWKDGKRSGQGTEAFANGDSYVGQWLYGLRNGLGTETFVNGDKYTGEWKADKRNGRGLEIMANGEQYEGEFRDGRRHGYGSLKLPNGDEYEGEWRMGRRRVKEPIFAAGSDYVDDDAWSRRIFTH